VSGEGKGPEEKFGQVISRERNENEQCRVKRTKTMSKPRELEDRGISSGGTCKQTGRHPACRWPEPRRGGRMNMRTLATMPTEKPQVD
jgi:hypothetical protein